MTQLQLASRSLSRPGFEIAFSCFINRMKRLKAIARRNSLPAKIFTASFIPEGLSRLPPALEDKVNNSLTAKPYA